MYGHRKRKRCPEQASDPLWIFVPEVRDKIPPAEYVRSESFAEYQITHACLAGKTEIPCEARSQAIMEQRLHDLYGMVDEESLSEFCFMIRHLQLRWWKTGCRFQE